MLKVVCPACQGTDVEALGPGRYLCNGFVQYTEQVLTDDGRGYFTNGALGVRWVSETRSRRCGHEFIKAPSVGVTPICACGSYSSGVCTGENCGKPVCPRHGTYWGGKLLCDECVSVIQDHNAAVRAAGHREAARREIAKYADLVNQLTDSSQPERIPDLIRELLRLGGERAQSWVRQGTGGEELDLPAFRAQVLPAWRLYLTAMKPEHSHEIVTFGAYEVSSGLLGARGSKADVRFRQPCWIVRDKKREGVGMYEADVDVPWAFTDTTAYLLDRNSVPPWGRFEAAPTLRGSYAIAKGTLPESSKLPKGRRMVSAQCLRAIDSRPVTPDDIIRIVRSGHLDYGRDWTLKPFGHSDPSSKAPARSRTAASQAAAPAPAPASVPAPKPDVKTGVQWYVDKPKPLR